MSIGGDGRSKQPNRRFGLPWHETCSASVFAHRLANQRARASARLSHSLRSFMISRHLYQANKKWVLWTHFIGLVEMARVELASESISAGISPSAVIVLVVSPLPAPNDRLRNQLSRCSSTLPGTRAEFSCIVDARHRAYR